MARIAYADPPYPGCARKHYACSEVDHGALLERLRHYDGWALSTSSVALSHVLLLCPDNVRVAAWVKPFCSFKPGVNPAYAWEPVLFVPASSGSRECPTVRDWVSANITLRKGLPGVKPDEFCYWLFELLGAEPTDQFLDLYPGSGAVTRAWSHWCSQTRLSLSFEEEG